MNCKDFSPVVCAVLQCFIIHYLRMYMYIKEFYIILQYFSAFLTYFFGLNHFMQYSRYTVTFYRVEEVPFSELFFVFYKLFIQKNKNFIAVMENVEKGVYLICNHREMSLFIIKCFALQFQGKTMH